MKKRAIPLKRTVMDEIRSLAVWLAAALWFLPMSLLLSLLSLLVHPKRTDWLSRFFCRVLLFILRLRVTVFCHPDVKEDRPYLFVQNHTNHFDFVVAYTATSHFKQGIELATHFRYPFYGWLMRARGTIPVRPGRKDQMGFLRERMRQEVAAGHSLLAFPEGHRTLNGRVSRFRKGLFRLAGELELPIIPIAVTGIWHVMRKGSLLIKPGKKLTIHIGAPIITKGLDDKALNALASKTRNTIAALVDDQEDQDQ